VTHPILVVPRLTPTLSRHSAMASRIASSLLPIYFLVTHVLPLSNICKSNIIVFEFERKWNDLLVKTIQGNCIRIFVKINVSIDIWFVTQSVVNWNIFFILK
jgi:hypothetical protein